MASPPGTARIPRSVRPSRPRAGFSKQDPRLSVLGTVTEQMVGQHQRYHGFAAGHGAPPAKRAAQPPACGL